MNNILQQKLKDKRLILASGSPRRKELLKGLDIPFEIETREVEEVYPEHLKAGEITAYLAELKAAAFNDLDTNDVLITADTIVWMDNNALMKPKDREEAIEILEKLSDKKHEVFTSVCIKSIGKTKVFTTVTEVYFEKLNLAEITYYVDTYKPFDKAGAYGAQDWIGYIGIRELKGSYFNVMGLPVHDLYKELLQF